MIKNFIYHVPTKIYFGQDQMHHLPEELGQLGKRVLLVYGGGSIKKTGLYDRIMTLLQNEGFVVTECPDIEPNPRHTSVNRGAALCKANHVDVILAAGGGSVIDAAKFIGAAACYDGDAWDLVSGRTPIKHALPLVTVLTLSATGSEMDAGGVITNWETKEKLANAHPAMLPKVSFLNPENTYSVSSFQTACGGADILSHIMEVYFNRTTHLYMIDTFMEGLMRTVMQYTPLAMAHPEDYDARANLMWSSSWAINGLMDEDSTQAWTCHPIEHELSAFYDITHGLGLAIVTPRWMRHVLSAETAPRFRQWAINVWGIQTELSPMDGALAGIEKLEQFFFRTLGLTAHLKDLNIDERYFEKMAERVCGPEGKLEGYVALDRQDVVKILLDCL